VRLDVTRILPCRQPRCCLSQLLGQETPIIIALVAANRSKNTASSVTHPLLHGQAWHGGTHPLSFAGENKDEKKDCDGVQDATENTPTTCNQSLNPMSPSSHPSSNVSTARSIYPGLATSTLPLAFSSRGCHVRSWDCAEVQSVFARGTGRTMKRRRRWQTKTSAWAPHCASSPS
jgi:hypothetical protein